MYKTGSFNKVSEEEMVAFMKANDFALVTGNGGEFPVASQLPLKVREADGKVFLDGHLMRKTDHHLAFERSPNVLAVFYSPHAYINAEWYEHPARASTVNYMAVHAKGNIRFLSEEDTYTAIRDITDKYIGTSGPASFSNLPEDYVAGLVKAIVGFRIEVKEMQAVFKLSQNHGTADAHNIISELEKRNRYGDAFIAGEMKKIFTDAS